MKHSFRSKSIIQLLETWIYLWEYWVNNWALSKEQSLKVLEIMKDQSILVLWWDICTIDDTWFHYDYSNWSYDKDETKSNKENTIDSVNKALKYIESYPVKWYTYFILAPENKEKI